MCFDAVQLEGLPVWSWSLAMPRPACNRSLTWRIASSPRHPATSLLFLNTSRLAPISRCVALRVSRVVAAAGERAAHLLQEKLEQLVSAIVQTCRVRRVDYPDERVRLLKVVLPVRAECLLASYIP